MGGDNESNNQYQPLAPSYQTPYPPPTSYPPNPVYPPQVYGAPHQNMYQHAIPITTITCHFHPTVQAINKCYSCGKTICLACSNELRSRFHHVYCPDCFGGAKTTRCVVGMVSMIVVIVVMIIIFSVAFSSN